MLKKVLLTQAIERIQRHIHKNEETQKSPTNTKNANTCTIDNSANTQAGTRRHETTHSASHSQSDSSTQKKSVYKQKRTNPKTNNHAQNKRPRTPNKESPPPRTET